MVLMTEIIGARFRKTGKIYYFDPLGINIEVGSNVILETSHGEKAGIVAIANRKVLKVKNPLKRVIRFANEEDLRIIKLEREREAQAIKVCAQKIEQHGLEMRLIDAEFSFDNLKIIFYFKSESRVDFRELVKTLASVFKMRIELRQVGSRDEARILNGLGVCGRSLCCAAFLDGFHSIKMDMAKEQGLMLNPSKISGVCSRLMCCIKYEEESYEHFNSGVPNIGDWARTPDGDGEVIAVNALWQKIKISVRKNKSDPPVISDFPIDKIKILSGAPPKRACESEAAASNCGCCVNCSNKKTRPNAPVSRRMPLRVKERADSSDIDLDAQIEAQIESKIREVDRKYQRREPHKNPRRVKTKNKNSFS